MRPALITVLVTVLVTAIGAIAASLVNLLAPGLVSFMTWSRRTQMIVFLVALVVSSLAVGVLAGLDALSKEMPETSAGSGPHAATAVQPAPSAPSLSASARAAVQQECRDLQAAAAAEEAALRTLSRSVRADPDNGVLLGPTAGYTNAYRDAVQGVADVEDAITRLLRSGRSLPELGPDVSYQRDTDRLKNQDLPRLGDGMAAETYSHPSTFNAWNELTRYADHARDISRSPCPS